MSDQSDLFYDDGTIRIITSSEYIDPLLPSFCTYLGSRYLRKYQDESTKVSMVSVSLLAGPPQDGHVVDSQSEAWARGLVPWK